MQSDFASIYDASNRACNSPVHRCVKIQHYAAYCLQGVHLFAWISGRCTDFSSNRMLAFLRDGVVGAEAVLPNNSRSAANSSLVGSATKLNAIQNESRVQNVSPLRARASLTARAANASAGLFIHGIVNVTSA